MSDSEHSLVTYTSVPSPVKDYLDIGSPEVDGPPSPDYVLGPEEPEQAPLSPNYVPGPEEPEQTPPLPVYLPYVPELVYPEYMPPEDDFFPSKEISPKDTETSVSPSSLVGSSSPIRRFQELATLCPNMVPNTEKLMEAFIDGLPRSIEGNVTASKPQTFKEAINIAQRLMDQIIKHNSTQDTNDHKRKFDDKNITDNNNYPNDHNNNYQNNHKNRNHNNDHHQQHNRKQETFKTYVATNRELHIKRFHLGLGKSRSLLLIFGFSLDHLLTVTKDEGNDGVEIIMVNVIPPNRIDDLPIAEPNHHDDVPVVPEPILVDEDEESKEEEFKEEEEPQEEEDDMEVDNEEDENELELTYPYEEVDPLNPPSPASELEPKDVIKIKDTVEFEDKTITASVHEVGELSNAPFLQEDSDGLLPGLIRRDINSLFG
nr:reverse transcriptase domain-containing protein [Tanacetum cinerariifolium]